MSDGLRRKDTTKGPPLRILSLDGGGVRGYSMLIIIQELMHRTYVEIHGSAPKRDQIPKPADHFDLICGTGTGGLIAIMLGRLRLDLETCKEVYTRMTRKVFETDKTIAGIPYRSTLFKASMLEEAIRECVRDHTVYSDEGNDDPDASSMSSAQSSGVHRHSSNASVASFSNRSPGSYGHSRQYSSSKRGKPGAYLYDARENRTKTAVTAVYKGTPKGGQPAFLRSYDSRKEPAPEFNCTIWQAGRATSATGLAFKPIQIGQSVFIDEGAGQYNPSPSVLDEATINEWPGRDVGVFVSIGTGKRPKGSDQQSHLWYEGFMGEFAEARRRLISKIEGCEDVHQYMVRDYLGMRGVNTENYYRLNVEIGVGEFGMNEWNRLADISTGTRRYLGKSDVQRMNLDAAAKMAKIYKAHARLAGREISRTSAEKELPGVPEAYPLAVELPAEVPLMMVPQSPSARQSYESGADTLAVPTQTSPHSSNDHINRPHTSSSNGSHHPPSSNGSHAVSSQGPPSSSGSHHPGTHRSSDSFVVNAPTPLQYQSASGTDKIAIMSQDEYPRPPEPLRIQHQRTSPPPLPPKTPLPEEDHRHSVGSVSRVPLPYPMDDGPPPVVNVLRKPDYRR